MGLIDGLAKTVARGAALQAGAELVRAGIERVQQSEEERRQAEAARQRRRRVRIALGGGGALGLLLLLVVAGKLLLWLVGLGVVAGLGAGAWWLARPRLRALQERRATHRAEAQVAAAAAGKEQRLEDELAALRRKAGG